MGLFDDNSDGLTPDELLSLANQQFSLPQVAQMANSNLSYFNENPRLAYSNATAMNEKNFILGIENPAVSAASGTTFVNPVSSLRKIQLYLKNLDTDNARTFNIFSAYRIADYVADPNQLKDGKTVPFFVGAETSVDAAKQIVTSVSGNGTVADLLQYMRRYPINLEAIKIVNTSSSAQGVQEFTIDELSPWSGRRELRRIRPADFQDPTQFSDNKSVLIPVDEIFSGSKLLSYEILPGAEITLSLSFGLAYDTEKLLTELKKAAKTMAVQNPQGATMAAFNEQVKAIGGGY